MLLSLQNWGLLWVRGIEGGIRFMDPDSLRGRVWICHFKKPSIWLVLMQGCCFGKNGSTRAVNQLIIPLSGNCLRRKPDSLTLMEKMRKSLGETVVTTGLGRRNPQELFVRITYRIWKHRCGKNGDTATDWGNDWKMSGRGSMMREHKGAWLFIRVVGIFQFSWKHDERAQRKLSIYKSNGYLNYA